MDVTRRSLIGRALLILGTVPAWLMGCALRRTTDGHPPAPASLDAPAAAGQLSTTELEALVAFGEVLVEGRPLAPAERGYLVEHLEERTRRSPGYLSLYRTTAGMLERLAGRRFAGLELRDRVELVARHRLGAWRGFTVSEAGPFSTEMHTIRTRVVPDLIRGYYASPAGWAAVGYDSFPGRCGDLTRYTSPQS